MIDLDELEKLAKAATPGPWHFHQDDGTALDISEVCIPRPEEDVDLSIASMLEDRDGAFIAAANPATVLALIERVRRVEAERDAALARIAEAAKLHRKRKYWETDKSYIFVCGRCRHLWPCDDAKILGLNEGESE